MTLIDANIFMYAGGAPHPNKAPSGALLERVARGEVDAAIDAEALQEILHRCRAIGRWKDGRQVYDLARRCIAVVIPITVEVMDEARGLMDTYSKLTARDALHGAVCRVAGADGICSYDSDLDIIAGLTRVEPSQVR